METIITLISSTIIFLLFHYCTSSFLNKELSFYREDFGGFIMIVLASFASFHYSLTSILLIQFSFLIYIDARHKLSISHTLILFILTYALIMIEKLGLEFLFLFFQFPVYHPVFPVFSDFMVFVFTIFLFRYSAIETLYQKLLNAGIFIQILLINSHIFISAILFFYTDSHSKFYENILYFLCSAFFLLIANFYLLYYDQKLSRKSQELISYQKNLPLYQSLIDEIRSNQHEFSNRIQHLQFLPYTCKDYDSLCNALWENTKNYKKANEAYPLLQIHMPLLAAALYDLYCQGNQRDISFSFDVASVDLQSQIPEYQLTDLICILTQNAIEACNPSDTIYIRLESSDGLVRFTIRNPVEQLYSFSQLGQFFQKGYSTKEDRSNSHGFGLYHLRSFLKKSDGSIEADCYSSENTFWISFSIEI